MGRDMQFLKNFYRVDEVAEILSVSRRTIYRMIRDGRLEGVKFGFNRVNPVRVTKQAIKKLIGLSRVQKDE